MIRYDNRDHPTFPPYSALTAAGSPATIVFAHRAGRDWIRGSEQCLLDLVRGLDSERFRSVVVCDAPALAREVEAAGATAVHLAEWGSGPIPRSEVRRGLIDVLKRHDAALVHVNTPNVLPSVLPGARRLRLPLVAHLHLPSTEADRLHGLLHQATVVVGVSRFVLAPLQADGFSTRRLRLIYNGVDMARLTANVAGDHATNSLRATLDVAAETTLIAGVGSLIHRKGHDVTIRALAMARDRGANMHLMLAGDGEAEPSLRALAAELGVTAAVHFLGYQTDIGAVLRSADFVVTSAREETLGLNVLEAQALGRAVVASDIPPHREALQIDETGLLVPLEQPEALASAFLRLASDAPMRDRLGAAGPAFVAERFAMRRYLAEFEDLYTTLLSRPPRDYGWVGGTRWPRAYTDWGMRLLVKRVRRLRSGG